MNYEVVISPQAENDILELIQYLTPVAGEKVAKAYVDRLIDYCLSFRVFPQRGMASDRAQGLRIVGYRRKATIAFRINGNVITIARILHRGRDLKLDDIGSA